MIEGLWIVQYVGLQGDDAGVVVFVNGRVLGGDNGWAYVGEYAIQNNMLTARVHVSNFQPGIQSVLGIDGDFDLEITAPLAGDVIQGAATLVGRDGAGVAIRLTKKASL
jgi:hypothetical protein